MYLELKKGLNAACMGYRVIQKGEVDFSRKDGKNDAMT